MVFAPFVGVQSPTPEKHALLAGAAGGAGPPPGTTLQVRLLNADALRPPLWFFRLWVQLPWTCPDWSKQPMQPPQKVHCAGAPGARHVRPAGTDVPSHVSPSAACSWLSPHLVQSFRQPSVSMPLPSSHISPAWFTLPSPHTGLQRQSAPQVDVATQPVGTAAGSHPSPAPQVCPAPHVASDVHGVFEP